MKKLLFIGLVLTLFSVAASAQQASGESFRHRKMEQTYKDGQFARPGMEKHRAYRDGKISRSEHHRLNRMHRHHHHGFRHHKHNRHHRNF